VIVTRNRALECLNPRLNDPDRPHTTLTPLIGIAASKGLPRSVSCCVDTDLLVMLTEQLLDVQGPFADGALMTLRSNEAPVVVPRMVTLGGVVAALR
jgi:hypothetical protein